MEKLYSVQTVSELLHITRVTLYGYIKARKIKAVKVGKYWYISETNLNDFLNCGSEVVKRGSKKSDFGKYALAEVENEPEETEKQKREEPTNRLSADLYLITELLQTKILQNSDLLQLNTCDKNAIYEVIQFLYSKTELLYNKGQNTTPIGKDHAHILILSKQERKLVNELAQQWCNDNTHLENNYDDEAGQEKFNNVDTLRRFTTE